MVGRSCRRGLGRTGVGTVVVVIVSPPLTVTVAVTVTTDAVGAVVSMEDVDEEAVVLVADEALAAAWKAAKLEPGLTANTIPFWQCPV